MSKEIIYNTELSEKILKGVSKLADTVSLTFGPKGNNVMFKPKFKTPVITNDGITIAKEVSSNDPVEDMIIKTVCEAANKTNILAGDGTTGATILTRELIERGIEQINSLNVSPILYRKGMQYSISFINEELKKLSKDIQDNLDIEKIATISSQDENIGKMIASAIQEVGYDGIITIEESKSVKTELVVTEGMVIESTFFSPYFIEDQKTIKTEMEDCYILITDKTIGYNEQIIPILEKVARENKSLVIIAEEIEGEALQTLVVNKVKNSIDVIAIKCVEYGENKYNSLKDLAVLTGTSLFDEETGQELCDLELKQLGFAKKFVVEKEKSTIVSGYGDLEKINNRIDEIKSRFEKEDDEEIKSELRTRLAKLTGGVAIIRLGAQTEQELKEKYLRLEDALNATRSAIEEGIVPGGGIALLIVGEILKSKVEEMSFKTNDEKIGFESVINSLESPLNIILENAGLNSKEIKEDILCMNSLNIESLKNGEKVYDLYGLDVLSEQYVEMLKEGIIDPTKVIKCAINHALSIASTLLTTKAIIFEEE